MIYGDPYQKTSIANKAILEKLRASLPEAQLDDLFSLYPDFQIDVAAEQEKLKQADLVILQDPVYWYNVPSLTHRWFEEVLRYGWAYGEGGTPLQARKPSSA
nr:NAD(P)H-dependent oxidoreductase [Faecalibaculum rodentium]